MTDVIDPTTPVKPLPGQMPVVSNKIVRASEEPPVFINSAEFSGMGMDVFMDVGIVPVESISVATKTYQENPDKPPSVDFHVSFRFGMSVQSAILIHQRLSQFLQQSVSQASAYMERQSIVMPEKGNDV
jgi:hypothetical protein